MIGPAALLLAQAASPAPILPEMEQAGFEFRRCGTSDIEKICFYAAAPEEGHDILYLVVREDFYMVMARSVQCKGELSSRMDAGDNHFYTLGGRHYRTAQGAGFDQLLFDDYDLACAGEPAKEPLRLGEVLADAKARFAAL
ncbi:MAG: hypothetical protein RIC51_02570 [Erythrobacter sp.]|uniref:hypothetical protein n=1 Tax=Erythrobacter sp. TaxID=1042 RepID=UPI0032EE9E51